MFPCLSCVIRQKNSFSLSFTKECPVTWCPYYIHSPKLVTMVTMLTNSHIRHRKFKKKNRNSLNYPSPSELMKTTPSHITVVIGGNVETSKTVPSVFHKYSTKVQRGRVSCAVTCRWPPCRYYRLVINDTAELRVCRLMVSVGWGLAFVILTTD